MNKKTLLICCLLMYLVVMMGGGAGQTGGEAENTQSREVPVPSSDAWWSSDYTYRKSLNLSRGGGAVTDYQMEMVVHRSAGSDSGMDVYVSTKCEADYDDIRFTTSGASPALLDYWIQEYDAASATLWVEFDSIGTGDTTFFLYYGYASASAVSDGNSTFLFFDDFSSWDGDKWDIETGTGYQVSAGNLEIWYDGSDRMLIDAKVGYAETYDVALYSSAKHVDTSGNWVNFVKLHEHGTNVNDETTKMFASSTTVNTLDTRTANEGSMTTGGTFVGGTFTDFHTYSLTWNSTDVEFYLDGSLKRSHSADIPDDAMVPAYVSSTDNEKTYYDYVFFLQWQYVAPAWGTWGSEEEENHAPVNVDAKCTNLDDTYNLYPRVRWYIFTANTSDADGYADIVLVNLSLYDVTIKWSVHFNASTNTFQEGGTNPTWIELDTVGSTYSKSGTNVNVTFRVKLEWIHDECPDGDLYLNTEDTEADSDIDLYNRNYKVFTELDITGLVTDDNSGTSDRGGFDSVFYTSGTIVYEGYSTSPDDGGFDIVDVWVSCSNVSTTPWSDLILSGSVFNVTCDSDDTVSISTFTVKVVTQGGGSGGTDLCHATHTDTYISDRVNVTLSLTYTRRAVGVNLTDLTYTAVYEYDGAAFSGSLTLNDSFAQTTVGLYYYTVGTVDDSTHGITSYHSNTVSTTFDKPNIVASWYWIENSRDTALIFIDWSTCVWWSDNATAVSDLSYIAVYRNGSFVTRIYPLSGHFFTIVVQVPTSWDAVLITAEFTFTNSTSHFSGYEVASFTDEVEYNELYIASWQFNQDAWYVHIFVRTSWRNCTITVIDSYWDTVQWINTTKYDGPEGFSIDYDVNHEGGNHTVYVLIDGGAASISRTADYLWQRDYPDMSVSAGWTYQQIMLVTVVAVIAAIVLVVVVIVLRRTGYTIRFLRATGEALTEPEGRTRRDGTVVEAPTGRADVLHSAAEDHRGIRRKEIEARRKARQDLVRGRKRR